MRVCRRSFLRLSVGGAVAAGAATGAAAAKSLDAKVIELARRLLRQNASRALHGDRVALVDFSAPSWRARFHLVDFATGRVQSYLTAHGRGSDPAHTGFLQQFSNDVGSNASSRGAYVTGSPYDGKYGRSMRLGGLDPENSNAEARAIVIHPAWYVSDDMIARHGKLGRSEGGFAMRAEDMAIILEALQPGRLLYAGKFPEFSA